MAIVFDFPDENVKEGASNSPVNVMVLF